MPRYRVTDPVSGKTIVLTGDSPPTEQELKDIFAQIILRDPNRKPASAEQFMTQPEPDAIDALLGFLPAAGGTVGGIVGGIGGTVAGLGVGGVPGAIGGAALGGAAGEAAKELVDFFRGRDVPDTAGARMGEIGKAGVIQGGLEAGGAAAAAAVRPAARALMRGYIKPSLAGANIKEARQIVQTALDEALPVTKGGEARANRLIDAINADINSTLAKVKGKVDLHQVADRVRAFAKAKYFKPGIDDADYKAALAVADTIDEHASLALPNGAKVTKVNAATANQIKQDVRPPSRAYGTQSYEPEKLTRKVAGSKMRQAIEDTASAEGVTDIGAKNAREGRLIDAADAIRRAAGREENKGLNPTAVPNLLAGAYGGAELGRSGDPAEAATKALAARLALSPAVATRAAIVASKLARNGYSIAAAARAAIQLVQSEAEEEPQ